MPVELQLAVVLQALAGGRVFPDVAPEDTALPFITFQAVGGEPINFISGESPGKTNTRMQVNVWAKTRLEAAELAEQVEEVIRAAISLQPEVLTGRISTYDETTTYRGSMQDFSLWQ